MDVGEINERRLYAGFRLDYIDLGCGLHGCGLHPHHALSLR